MGSPSSVRRLPDSVREALHGFLRDPAITQAEARERANALLAEIDPDRPPLSRSAVNRYDLSMREVGAKIQQAREISEVWIAKLGSAPGGRTGHLVTEMIRTMVFEIMQRLGEGELDAESMPDVIEALKSLSLTAARVERASAISEQRERQIREDERRQTAEELARRAESEAGASGSVSAERLRQIAREVYGVQ